MIRNQEHIIDDIHYIDPQSRHRTITYVYFRGRKLWELIIKESNKIGKEYS